ncbi:glutathione S-transferase family protein [Kordiimonas sp. SCSIO 12610]|uniref:glutathione S-transferase family protein n=1 Tax=Kordiimonas sp. SCSIO 12610 TaxID=2829597 RepID=UPI002109ADDD|nr:glutathione S-transferase family protein [Kordiimonas sp. SCSIO 12610]UTW55775.1 glutathione S-transferase family protein [Kordiimonas sp. SCSIO 12610]
MTTSTAPYIMYGCPPSLYSGKLRCYLRKKALPFQERLPSHPEFFTRMVPAVGRMVMPILDAHDGAIYQDTTEIIDALEERHPDRPAIPASPKQKAVAHLFELFGDEGLLRPAMHYRWNFPEENDDFISLEFGRFMNPVADDTLAKELAAPSKAKMSGYLPALGITETTISTIEAAYMELLSALNDHFLKYPYILGGRSTIADYGLIGPLYAHLARDPAPAHIMKTKANRVWRWVERMNAVGDDMPEFPDMDNELLANDEIPETLFPVMEIIAKDHLPELKALCDFIDTHLEQNTDIEAKQPVIRDSNARTLGGFRVKVRDQDFDLMARHYSVWMLQRLTDTVTDFSTEDKMDVEALFEKVGLKDILSLRTKRRIERVNFKEVWA